MPVCVCILSLPQATIMVIGGFALHMEGITVVAAVVAVKGKGGGSVPKKSALRCGTASHCI